MLKSGRLSIDVNPRPMQVGGFSLIGAFGTAIGARWHKCTGRVGDALVIAPSAGSFGAEACKF